jgi:hypothetical protein
MLRSVREATEDRDAVIAAHDVTCEYKASPEAQIPRPDDP